MGPPIRTIDGKRTSLMGGTGRLPAVVAAQAPGAAGARGARRAAGSAGVPRARGGRPQGQRERAGGALRRQAQLSLQGPSQLLTFVLDGKAPCNRRRPQRHKKTKGFAIFCFCAAFLFTSPELNPPACFKSSGLPRSRQ